MASRHFSYTLSSMAVVCLLGTLAVVSSPARAEPDGLACAANYWSFALMSPNKAKAAQARAQHLIRGYVEKTPDQRYEAVAKNVDLKGRTFVANIQTLKMEAAQLVYKIERTPGSKAEKKALADQEHAKRKAYLDLEKALMADLAICEKTYFENKS